LVRPLDVVRSREQKDGTSCGGNLRMTNLRRRDDEPCPRIAGPSLLGDP
jgi:hypothetical protein